MSSTPTKRGSPPSIATELCGDREHTAIQALPGIGPTLAAVFVAAVFVAEMRAA